MLRRLTKKDRAGTFVTLPFRPSASAPRKSPKVPIFFPPTVTGDTLYSLVAIVSKTISVSAAIIPYSVAVKPFSLCRSRMSTLNISRSRYLRHRGNRMGLTICQG